MPAVVDKQLTGSTGHSTISTASLELDGSKCKDTVFTQEETQTEEGNQET